MPFHREILIMAIRPMAADLRPKGARTVSCRTKANKMQWSPLTTLLLAAITGLVTYLFVYWRSRLQRDTLSRDFIEARTATAKIEADFAARQEELRTSIKDARSREDEAKLKVRETESQVAKLTGELRATSEQKGQFQREAALAGRRIAGYTSVKRYGDSVLKHPDQRP